MLETLWIENFLTISRIEIDFDRGFTALTGETGVGKSMLMEALLLALGERADTEVIRTGSMSCEVSARFNLLPDSTLLQWAEAEGVNLSEGELLLTRQIHRAGRSKAYVNGKPCPLQLLKNIGQRLVHVHGQHAHHELMHAHTARLHVDRYAGNQTLLAEVQYAYDAYRQVEQELSALGEMEEVEQRLAFVTFQREELLALNLGEDELESLSIEHKRLHHLKDYLSVGDQVVALLASEEGGATQLLHEIQSLLRQLPSEEPRIQALSQFIEEALIQVKEANGEAQVWLEELVSDPERLSQIESRLSELHQAARKYRVDIKLLPQVLERLNQEHDALNAQLQRQPALIKQLDLLQINYEEVALALRKTRLTSAPELAAGISTHIRELGMSHGKIDIVLEPVGHIERHGLDRITYEVTTNPGMPPATLAKVASGGELSRISLAIELMTAERTSTPTLLFDEVDVGIGGKTASVVGRLMRQLGERAQVFCVTHQPQVAACAHFHVRVDKTVEHEQALTQACLMTESERITELARMLGGVNITEQAINHAKGLLEELM